MDRCALFVDAGWFLAESAQALTGRGQRWSIDCDYAQLTVALGQLAEQVTQLPLLRIYWYDAAPDAVPGPDHLQIAGEVNVKLRLGRISHNQQKGVDALLILDLTTLARERAVASALVISGDEDIREGIAAAQSLGVRVILGGVAMVEGRPSLATTLLHEADDQFLMDIGFLSRYMRTHVPVMERAPIMGQAPVTDRGQSIEHEPMPEPRTAGPNGGNQHVTARQFGWEFGASHSEQLSDQDLRLLQRRAPEIPGDVAANLFRQAEVVFGETRGRPELRRELRMGFWDHVMQRRNV